MSAHERRCQQGIGASLFSALARYNCTCWAIVPERLAAMLDAAGHIRAEAYEAALEAATRRQARQSAGGVARIPIYGAIEPKASIFTLLFGGSAVDLIQAQLTAALEDNDVKGILLDFDSPGGSVYGIPELARSIRGARGQKPILSIANAEMASAAYYIASQADEISIVPSGQAGSIGVIYLHTDLTGMAEAAGVKFTIFRSQERKADVNPYEALTEEAAEDIQSKVDAYDRMFVQDVAKGRGVSVDKVRGDYGQGRMMLAADALKAGMVDRIETVEEAVARLSRGGVAARQAPAAETTEAPIELTADVLARKWQLAEWQIPALAGAIPGGQ